MEDTTNSGKDASEVLSELIGSNKRDLKQIVPDSDLANAERFIKYFGDALRYVPESGWHFWTGERWRGSAEATAIECAKDTVRLLIEECMTYKGEQAKVMFKWAKISQEARKISSIVKLASSDDRIALPITAFDANPWLLNCENGTINLKNGSLAPHNPLNYCTRASPAKYGQALEPNSLWLNFLDTVTGGNADLKGYLKRVAGYCLTGSVSEKCFFFCYGGGDNGKTVFIEVLHALTGNYSIALSTETLIKKRYGNGGIPNDVARLHGPRLATVSETQKGEEWNDALIKDLTGGDVITARFLRQEYFDFRPQCKLMIRGNSKPDVTDNSAGMWKRIQLIPFEVQIAGVKQDKELREKIVRRELSGVLQWAVEGCLEWQNKGLAPPENITSAVSKYREDMDTIGQYIEDRIEYLPKKDVSTQASVIYQDYKKWAEDSGYEVASPHKFGREMSDRGHIRVRISSYRRYKHILLKERENEEQKEDENDSDLSF